MSEKEVLQEVGSECKPVQPTTPTINPTEQLLPLREGTTPYWWDVIDEAEARGSFTEDEKVRSGAWVTCACGKQDPRIPRRTTWMGREGMPVDKELGGLGCRFCDNVHDDHFKAARNTLIAIEQRAAHLLAELP